MNHPRLAQPISLSAIYEMKAPFSALASLVLAASSVSARTVFSVRAHPRRYIPCLHNTADGALFTSPLTGHLSRRHRARPRRRGPRAILERCKSDRHPCLSLLRTIHITPSEHSLNAHAQPVTDLTSTDLICNKNFVQPVSDVVASVPAGGVVQAEFHHTAAGYTGPDPSDPLDPTNKGEYPDSGCRCNIGGAPAADSYTLGPLLAYLYAALACRDS